MTITWRRWSEISGSKTLTMARGRWPEVSSSKNRPGHGPVLPHDKVPLNGRVQIGKQTIISARHLHYFKLNCRKHANSNSSKFPVLSNWLMRQGERVRVTVQVACRWHPG